MKFKFRRGFKANAEKTSLILRKELGLKPFEKLCGFDLAHHLSINVSDPVSIGLPENEARLLMDKSSGWSAVTINFENKQKLIIHNVLHSKKRQQSNLMHEMAHLLCEHEFPKLGVVGGSLQMRHYSKEQEAEAEWLGGSLQLPRQALSFWLKKDYSLNEIADYFEASKQMVRFRYNVTGLSKQYPGVR